MNWNVLGAVVADAALNAVTDPRVTRKVSLSAELFFCQTGAAASGVLATQAERAAVSLRRQESALTSRAAELQAHMASPHLIARPPSSLISVVRECWSGP